MEPYITLNLKVPNDLLEELNKKYRPLCARLGAELSYANFLRSVLWCGIGKVNEQELVDDLVKHSLSRGNPGGKRL